MTYWIFILSLKFVAVRFQSIFDTIARYKEVNILFEIYEDITLLVESPAKTKGSFTGK